jgi:hypothetical protein
MLDNGTLTDIEKLAVDATIKRQSSLLELMRHTDLRAQQLITVYTGLAGAAVLFATSPWFSAASTIWTREILGIYAAFLILGVLFALGACASVKVRLPSRGADFWLWALSDREPVKAFLD